jgi:uncharacterized repeat protein (TIGR03803 family)
MEVTSDRSGIFSIVHTFTDTPDGSLPSKLIQASDGTIYGLTASGGAKFGGTVYKVNAAGTYSVLHPLKPVSESSGPTHLIEGSDGFFYGTTGIAGTPDPKCSNHEPQGTLFRRARLAFASAIFEGPSDDGTTISLNLRQNIPIADLSFVPNPVKGGQSSTATVTLTRPAGTTGQVVNLMGSCPVTVPPTVTIGAGQVTTSFTVNTQPVTATIAAGVTAYIVNTGVFSPLSITP